MGMHPRIRCPACGMLIYLHQLKQTYEVDYYIVQIGGKDKAGKPILNYDLQPSNADVVKVWISRLEVVLEQMQRQSLADRIKIAIPKDLGSIAFKQGISQLVVQKPIAKVEFRR